MDLSQMCTTGKDVTMTPNKSVIINSQKWNSILKHLNRNEEAIQQSEQEKKYKEYLKEGSAEMTCKWMNSIEKTRENKAIERQKREAEKIIEGERRFKELKENDEKARLEQVAKAQQMMNRLRIGTRDLESAALLSEVLKGRELQCNLNADLNKSMSERKKKEAEQLQIQSVIAIEEQQRQMMEAKKRTDDYKNEVYRMAKDEAKRKMETSRRQTEYEKRMREQADKELQAQIERERAILQRKKEAMRKNALEAMKMVEQRRLRDKMENEIDNKIIEIFAKGKNNIADMKKEKDRQKIEEIVRMKDANAQKVFVQAADRSAEEEERLRKAVKEANDKLDQQEKDRIQRERILKAARIKQYLEDMERQKIAKAKQMEHIRWSIANRLKNEEVNQEFEKMKAQEKIKRAQEIRAVLLEQMKERKEMEQKQREQDSLCVSLTNERDDKNFMEFANVLIEDAKKKSRPILPLMRAVDKYKKASEMDVERKEPRHLKSNLPIQDKVEGTCACAASTSTSPPKNNQPIIKYDLNELKQLNPRVSPRTPLWA